MFDHLSDNTGIVSAFGLGERVLLLDVCDLYEQEPKRIVELIQESQQTAPLDHLIFARFGDGAEERAVILINETVKMIIERQVMPFEKISYLTNIDPCVSNRAHYSQILEQYAYLPPMLCHSANRQNLAGSNPGLVTDPLPPLALSQGPKQKNFLCFNRGLRLPRIIFVAEMLNRNLDQNSFVSLDPVVEDAKASREQIKDLTSSYGRKWMQTTGLDQVDLSRVLERAPLSLGYSPDRLFKLNDYDISLFAQSRISIVNEALFYYSHNEYLHPNETGFYPMSLTSEKLQKCFMLGHPFMCVGTPGQLKSLHEMGYKTFGNVIDESYDNIAHDGDRMFAVLAEMERLNKFTDLEWEQFVNAVHDRVDHNRNVFVDRMSSPETRWLNAS